MADDRQNTGRPDASGVGAAPASRSYDEIVREVAMTQVGGELHHVGWNAGSSMLCPNAPRPHLRRTRIAFVLPATLPIAEIASSGR